MNNAVYDTTIENLRNRITERLGNSKRLFEIDIKTKLYDTKDI